MKKISVILLTIILSMVFVGCSNKSEETNQQYEDAMSNGKSNVIEEEYNKAIDYFELALESKEKDTEATNLIKQLKLLVELLEEDGVKDQAVYFYQIGNIQEINSIKTKTNVVKDKANKYKKVVLENINDEINNIEMEINNGDYENDLEYIAEQCEEYKLKDQLDRCNELLDICKEKKKEAEKQSKKEKKQKSLGNYDLSSEEAWCGRGQHYTDIENMADDFNCYGCLLRRQYSSTSSYTQCMYCGIDNAVSPNKGICSKCGEQNYPAIVEIYDNGTALYEDGSTIDRNGNVTLPDGSKL